MKTIHPAFQLSEQTHPGLVALKVANLEHMTKFYQEVIGLTLRETSERQSMLGTEETTLLILTKVANPLPVTRKTGLYHVAFLLPTRRDLGNALYHYLTVNAPIAGASDHGYSEALYLTDPEGNGIEVYRDKPKSEWDIREDGEIVGITIEMDADGVLAAADRQHATFPKGTTVGHVHLKVADLDKTEQFYTNSLGLTLKSDFGKQAKFFATGTYHHHIGSNIWMGHNIPAMSADDLGLDYYTFVTNQEELSKLEAHWQNHQVDYVKEDNQLITMDPNGIKIKFQLAKHVQ